MTTVRYPVWRLCKEPSTRCVIAAYNQTLASKFSRKARRLAETRLSLATDRTAVDDWETLQGGGIRAVGVGGGVTGQGFNLLIIDDPVKSREEAESEVYREKLWDWYTDDLYTRQEPGAAIILIMTRWHAADLAGRILESEQASEWEVIKLPAFAEDADPLGRELHAPLCPERYDTDALNDIRATQSAYTFEALFQQNPTLREGAFFNITKIEIVDAVPAGLRECRAWDLAASSKSGDRTAGVRIGVTPDNVFYVTDCTFGQYDPDTVRRLILQTASLDGRRVKVHIPQDPGQAGKDQAQQLVRMLAGYPVLSESISGDKQTRAFGFAAQVNAGNVKLLKGDWNKVFIEELRQFPTGKYDDIVDAGGDSFNEIATSPQSRGVSTVRTPTGYV